MAVSLSISNGRKYFWQWDNNQYLIATELPVGAEVHFDVPDCHTPLKTLVEEANGQFVCRVPDEILQEAGSFKVWVYVLDKGIVGNRTIFNTSFTVEKREKIPGYVYTAMEALRYDDLKARIEDVESGCRVPAVTEDDNGKVLTAVNGDWVAEELPEQPGGTVEVDPTLSVEGMAADSKATGEAIGKLSEEIVDIKKLIGGEEDGIGRATGTVVAARGALSVPPTVMNIYGRTDQNGKNSNDPGLFLYHRGKNLLIAEDTVLTSNDGTNKEIWLDYTRWRGVIEGNTYTISLRAINANVKTGRVRINVWGGTSNSIIASTLQSNLGECDLSLTFIVTEPLKSIQILFTGATAGDTITVTKLQCELGTKATTYEPYDAVKSSHFWASMPGGLAGIPVTTGGNYCDEYGQQWLCDTLDMITGKLVRRCAKIESYAGENITGSYLSSTGELTAGATVVYTLNEPVEGNFNTSEYNSISFQYPNFTVFSNGNAWIEMEYTRDVEIEPETDEVSVQEAFDPRHYSMDILYLEGDTTGMNKDNAVDLSYRYKDKNGTASVKWQGSSSLAFPKKNYTIEFDQEFEVVEGWGAQKKYCFKANFIDHSHARNVCAAKLWGQVTKSRSVVPSHFANLVNGGAVDGFPVAIMLNDKFHGLYTWNIPKDGWMAGMGSGDREAIVCADNSSDEERVQTGFRNTLDELGGAFEVEYCPDENDTGWILESLNRLITACINSDGSDLDTTIAQYLDWDSAIDSYIFTTLINGHDNVIRNYLLVTYDGVKWYWVQYDMDETFGQIGSGLRFKNVLSPNFETSAGWHRVYELIKLYKKDELKARYEELRNGVMNEMNVHGVFANFVNKIPPAALLADLEKYPSIPSANASNMAQILHFYGLTCNAADKAIDTL